MQQKNLSKGELERCLTPLWQKNGVLLAFLFGSRATGKIHEQSDLDLAIWVDGDRLHKHDWHKAYQNLLAEITEVVGMERVDLVLLNHATPLLQYEVARNSVSLFEAKPGLITQFKVRAVQRHQDAWYLGRWEKVYLERVAKGGLTNGKFRTPPPQVN